MTLPYYDLSVYFDYKTKQTTASLTNPHVTGSTAGHLFRMYDEKGTIIQSFPMTSSEATEHGRTLQGTGSFGLLLGQGSSFGGYDTSIARQDTTGVTIAYKEAMWEMSREFDLFGSISTLENAISQSVYLTLDKRDNMYLNTPMLITGGDAVVQGTVSTVTGDTYMSLTYDKSIAPYSGYNINNSICKVLSGANEGETFSVTSHTLGNSYFLVDTDVNHLSGQVVAVMPYREVTSYSGWTYTGTNNDNLGDDGLKARFGLNEAIPAGPGSLHYTTGTYSGDASVAHALDVLQSKVFTASVVALKDDAYMRSVTPGDVVYFTPSSAPSAEATGVILEVTTGHGVPAEGDFTIKYWPARAATSSSEYKISRTNSINLYSFPELNREYLCLARTATATDFNSGEKYITKVSTPSVNVDFSANEYESVFPSIPESSHFHIGPVYLSNGQTLMDDGVGSNGILPQLRFSGLVYNGDPESPATIINSQGFSTQNPNAAHKFNGMYYKDGVMTMSADLTFNASETMICKAVIDYGSIKIDKVFTIPVQPSV